MNRKLTIYKIIYVMHYFIQIIEDNKNVLKKLIKKGGYV